MSHVPKKTSRRPGIRALFAFTVLGPAAVLGVVVLWLGGRAVERAVQERLEEDVQLVARAIQLPLSRALAEGRAEQLYEALESAFRIRRLYGAAVYDAAGELVAQVGAADVAPEADVGRVAEEGRGGAYGQVGERRVYSYFVPLTSPGGRVEGLLQVTRRRSDIEEAVRSVRGRAAVVFGVLLLTLGATVLLTYERGVGRHFRRLSEAMAGVEQGAREARVEERGPREVAEIAGAFNRMVAGVERAEARVAAQRRREAALEERLRRSAKLAAIGRLAGGVAHELGTPLAVVDGMAQRLTRRGAGVEEASAIREAVRRMSEIVRELLAFGAWNSGERQRVRARSLVVGATAAIREDASSRGVTVDVSHVSDGVELVGDAARVEAALVHLLRNGVAAAGSEGRVRVGVERRGDRAAFIVEDSGSGVPDELRDRVFEPFFTTKRVGEGSGLGLAVVHSVAEEHGGSVEIDRSQLGGARFTLELPASGEEESDG